MSAVSNNSSAADKTAKRKKTRGGDSVANLVVPKVEDSVNGDANGGDGDSAYTRELQKGVRNLRKKLANTEKAQSIVDENAGRSLDELLAERKLNADQKKQIENKPAVEAQLKSTEEQLEHYRKFEEENEKRTAKRMESEKETWTKEHEQVLEAKDKEHEQSKAQLELEFKKRLLMLSRFLRTAAARRQSEEKLPEDDAFEGVLLQLYGGDAAAVSSMEKLISGHGDNVHTVEGAPSDYTFKHIHDIVQTSSLDTDAQEVPAEAGAGSDPTMVHAGLTEIEQEAQPIVEAPGTTVVPESATVDADAANAAAVSLTSPQDLSASVTSDNWVEVRNPDETDTGYNATPAAITNQETWAEDVPTDSVLMQSSGDGFSEVKHGRGGRGGRSRGGGGGGGRGRGEGFRGRGRGGFRGDGEHRGRGGRGRGGYRGPRGGGGGSAGGQAGGDAAAAAPRPAQS